MRAELLVEVGRTARLGCEVRGYPAPETGWYKDETGEIRLDKPRPIHMSIFAQITILNAMRLY